MNDSLDAKLAKLANEYRLAQAKFWSAWNSHEPEAWTIVQGAGRLLRGEGLNAEAYRSAEGHELGLRLHGYTFRIWADDRERKVGVTVDSPSRPGEPTFVTASEPAAADLQEMLERFVGRALGVR